MAFSFELDKPRDLEKTLASVRAGIQKQKGTFTGDTSKGSISLKGVKGTYSVGADSIKITVTEKPFIVSEAFVKKEIAETFRKCGG